VKCLHCREREAAPHRRGLCRRCYAHAEVRCLYQRESMARPNHEPTEEELEVTIAEQRKRLPRWWSEDTARMEAGERDD
jgi:hypothetical protein